MKFTIVALLVAVLLVGLANLLENLGLIGSSDYQYKALPAIQLDAIGFRKLAKDNEIEEDEDGKINFPSELKEKLLRQNMLPLSISEVEKDGGWQFVSVSSDNHYLFRKKR